MLGGPIVKNKAFFFVDYEGFRQTASRWPSRPMPDAAQRQGILSVPVRNPITGALYAAGTPIPMTPFAARCLPGCPTRPAAARPTTTRCSRNSRTTTTSTTARSTSSSSPRLSAFARFGQRDADIFDQPPLPLPSGGAGNGITYVTNKQFATGLTWSSPTRRSWEFRFG